MAEDFYLEGKCNKFHIKSKIVKNILIALIINAKVFRGIAKYKRFVRCQYRRLCLVRTILVIFHDIFCRLLV